METKRRRRAEAEAVSLQRIAELTDNALDKLVRLLESADDHVTFRAVKVQAPRRHRKCMCKVGAGGTESIVLAGPSGDDSARCPDCGGGRIVVGLAFDRPARSPRASECRFEAAASSVDLRQRPGHVPGSGWSILGDSPGGTRGKVTKRTYGTVPLLTT